MIGKLIFKLPEENEEFELAQKAGDYAIVLHEMDNWLRAKIKYEELPEEQEKIFQEVRDKLREFTQERNLDV